SHRIWNPAKDLRRIREATGRRFSASVMRRPCLHHDESVMEQWRMSIFSRRVFHMAPSGDMPDPESQRESFSLANMIPQNPNNNRNLWEGIETAVRDVALYDGEVYVVTGPIFQGATLQRLHGRVLVPTGIFKAIYDPRRNAAGAYVVDNAPGMAWKAVSVADLDKLVGIDVFPALPA